MYTASIYFRCLRFHWLLEGKHRILKIGIGKETEEEMIVISLLVLFFFLKKQHICRLCPSLILFLYEFHSFNCNFKKAYSNLQNLLGQVTLFAWLKLFPFLSCPIPSYPILCLMHFVHYALTMTLSCSIILPLSGPENG